jgi:hypothetical protein
MKLITYSLNDNLNDIQISCIKSWIKNKYQIDLYSYSPLNINLKINVINPEKIIKKKYIDKISVQSFKRYIFKITLLYKIGGLLIDPDVYCLKNYNFNEKIFISFSPTSDYKDSFPDFSIIKLPKKYPILKYIINNFEYLYNDYVNGYNENLDICQIINKVINKVYKINKIDWKLTHSCYEEHWQTQVNKKLDNINGYTTLKKDLQYFLKIWSEKIKFPLQNNSLLGKIFVKNIKK